MNILVINAGSSTLKFQLINMDTKKVLAKGNVEKINEGNSFLRYKANGKEVIIDQDFANHAEGLKKVLETLIDSEVGVIKSLKEISAFGHRVVNVGDTYFDACLITPEVLADFKTKVEFSPLHVPGAIAGIEGAMAVSSETPNVAVFDIGFHKTLPAYAYLYGLPKRYYDEYKIRRYGAHGTSHFYVANRCADLMGKDIKDLKIITCHLGGGASITAVNGGKSVDTSMGFTPLEGLMMNTRSGDLDPAILEFIAKKENKTISELLKVLNKESGLLGATGGVMADMRDITSNLDKPEIKLAFDMYCYRIMKYVASYAGVLNGVDAIVFTAGCGENTPELREQVCDQLTYLGVELNKELNANLPRGQETEINTANSKVKVYVIPTDEEMVIAEETKKLIQK